MKKQIVAGSLAYSYLIIATLACGGYIHNRNDTAGQSTDGTSRMTQAEIADLPEVDSMEEQEIIKEKLRTLKTEDDAFLFESPILPKLYTNISEPKLDQKLDPNIEANATQTLSNRTSVVAWGLHPRASAAIQAAGIPTWRITQTIGRATASAGYHLQDGTYEGHPYTAATDFSVAGLNSHQIRNMLERLGLVGFAAFYRHNGQDGWSGVEHIHAIYVNASMKSQLRSQIKSWMEGRNGLVGNSFYSFYKWSKISKNTIQSKFGASNEGTTNRGDDILPGAVYLDKLHYGQNDSDSVKRLQVVLGLSPIDGYYGPMTDDAVRTEQARAGYTPDPVYRSFVGPVQAGRIFPSSAGYTVYP